MEDERAYSAPLDGLADVIIADPLDRYLPENTLGRRERDQYIAGGVEAVTLRETRQIRRARQRAEAKGRKA